MPSGHFSHQQQNVGAPDVYLRVYCSQVVLVLLFYSCSVVVHCCSVGVFVVVILLVYYSCYKIVLPQQLYCPF